MYPYPDITAHLELSYSVAEFMSAIQQKRQWNEPPTEELFEYQRISKQYLPPLPRYCYAICPLCQTRHYDRMNTYTLHGWASEDLPMFPYRSIGRMFANYHKLTCPHYIGVDTFINFHQLQPKVPFSGPLAGNAHNLPYLIPWMLTDRRNPGFAVLHALPICRIEAGAFIPSYTVFMVSYFAQDYERIWREHWETEAPTTDDMEWYPWVADYTRTTPYHPDPYDLNEWTRRGVLGWLDYTQPDLPLRLGRGRILPPIYSTIVGDKHPQ